MTDSANERPSLATPQEVGTILNCSRSKVYELLARNEIPGKVVIGSSVRVHRATLERWLEDQARLATPAA